MWAVKFITMATTTVCSNLICNIHNCINCIFDDFCQHNLFAKTYSLSNSFNRFCLSSNEYILFDWSYFNEVFKFEIFQFNTPKPHSKKKKCPLKISSVQPWVKTKYMCKVQLLLKKLWRGIAQQGCWQDLDFFV